MKITKNMKMQNVKKHQNDKMQNMKNDQKCAKIGGV